MPSFLTDAKKLRVQSQMEEMQALDNAGMRQNGRYLELSYQVNEFEAIRTPRISQRRAVAATRS